MSAVTPSEALNPRYGLTSWVRWAPPDLAPDCSWLWFTGAAVDGSMRIVPSTLYAGFATDTLPTQIATVTSTPGSTAYQRRSSTVKNSPTVIPSPPDGRRAP